jgi:hypothetical protein
MEELEEEAKEMQVRVLFLESGCTPFSFSVLLSFMARLGRATRGGGSFTHFLTKWKSPRKRPRRYR